jgi:MFS transporter, Spinster family, sphingosine-1-phosphate transporter
MVSAVTNSSRPPVARRLARSGLAALTLVNLLNYLDRYVIAALLPDLERAHMGLTRFRLGMLMTGFLVVYMCFAFLLFGPLGDRRSRPRVIAVGVLLWSLATTLSGLARNYFHLLLGRAVVGIGEAAYGTISPALLADYFPRSARGRVFAVFFMAIPVGSALGYIVGGLMDHWYGWRAAFFVAGLPGLALAVWVLRLPDPPRGAQEQPPHVQQSATLSRTALSVYWSLLKRLPYMLTVLGYAAYTFAVGGLAFWMPDFLESVRRIPAAQATTGFGAIVVATGFVGTFAGGWLGDYWLRFSREAYLWLSALTALGAVPFSIVALTAGTPVVYYSAIVAAELLLFMSTGPINSAIVNLVAPGERASAVAVSVFLIHVLGDVISPPLIGALSDLASLASAVLIVPVAIAACGGLWLAAGSVSRSRSSAPA